MTATTLNKPNVHMQAPKLFLRVLLELLDRSPLAKKIACIAILGSWASKENTRNSDYDLLIILEGSERKDPTNFKAISSLLCLIRRTQRILRKVNITVTVFHTFRVEEFHRSLIEKISSQYVLLHLLLYPSIRYFKKWNHPELIHSMCRNAIVVYGSSEVLDSLHNIPPNDVKTRIETLLSLLVETFVYFLNSELPDYTISREAFQKLQYVVRHTCEAVLMERGTVALTWSDILNNLDDFGEFASFISRVYQLRSVSSLSHNELRMLFRFSFEFLNNIMVGFLLS